MVKIRRKLNESAGDTGANIIICPKEIKKVKNTWKVFLAGPIQGAEKWQFDVPAIDNVTYFCPRRKSLTDKNFDYNEQVSWETYGLRISDIVLFWIPAPAEDIEGRSYAQTTRFELAENIARGKRIIIGTYKDFPGRKYIEYKAKNYKNVIGVYDSLEDCIKCLKDYIKKQKPTVWFTSDTHFGSDRALELSKRPFSTVEEMDMTLVERWNTCVNPGDQVYHLGDFGDENIAQYLNGDIHFLYGNYERDGKDVVNKKNFVEVNKKPFIYVYDKSHKFYLTHEPINGKKYMKRHDDADFVLFGHIHGRQKVKEFGLDVGVDAHNFKPISIDDVLFYMNAIKKGYYDEEVWS